MTKALRGEADLASLISRLLEEKRRVERLLQQVEVVLRNAAPPAKAGRGISHAVSAPRPSPLDRVKDYFFNVMQYDLDERKLAGLSAFRERCLLHGLIPLPGG